MFFRRSAAVILMILMASTAFAQLEPEGPKFDFSALDLPPQSEAIVINPVLPMEHTGWAWTEDTQRCWMRPGPRTVTLERLARALELRSDEQVAVRDSKTLKLWRITEKLEKALFEQPRSLLVGVEEINRRHVWYHQFSRTIDLERYPILVMTYRGTNVSNRVGYTIFVGDSGGTIGGYFGFPTSYIKDDGEIQQASHDMRRPAEGVTKGPIRSVAVGLRVDEFYGPGRLEILDLRFMRAEDSPPAIMPKLGKPLTVKVTDQQNQPVEGARVTVDYEFLTFARSGVTNAEGLALITPYESPNSMYTIVVEKKGMVPMAIRQMPLPAGVVSFQLTPSTACCGQVVDDQGNPVMDAAIVLQPSRRAGGYAPNGCFPATVLMQSSALTDQNGRWRCSEVNAPNGQVTIQVSHNNYAFHPDETVAAEALREGTHATVVGEGISFEVIVRDEAGRAIERPQFTLKSQSTSHSATGDVEGKYEFRRITAGGKTLEISAPRYLSQTLSVNVQPDMPTFEVTMKPGRTLRLRIVDRDDRPVGEAYVYIYGQARQPWTGRSDNEGRVTWTEAPEGEISFHVSAQGYMSLSGRAPSDGEEHEIKISVPTMITGSVVDDATGKPIAEFRVIEGMASQAGQTPQWQRSLKHEGRGGRYEFIVRQIYPFRAVMIEADGYLPAISETFPGDKENPVVDFRLKKGEPLIGRVINPDGRPVANAKVAVIMPGMNVQLNPPEFRTDAPSALTNADGRYELPPQAGGFTLIAIGDEGYAQVKVADPAALPDLTLQAWGRVRGRYLVGDKPAVTQIALHPVNFSNSQVYWNFQMSTNEDGVFLFDRVPPGSFSISTLVSINDSMRTSGKSRYAEVTAGNVTEVQLGGVGRPVIGKIKDAPGGGFVRGNINSAIKMPSPPWPDNLREMPAEAQQRWREEWLGTPEGQAYQKQVMEARMNSFGASFAINADGTFKADDIPEGTYNLNIYFQSTDFNQYKNLAQKNFTVAPIPGGRSDEPLDLGELEEMPGR